MSGSQRRLLASALGVAVIVVLAAVLLTVPFGGSPSTSPAASGVEVDGSPLLGKPVPDVTLTDLAGNSVRLADLLGEPSIVNVWASWCVPCREEFPLLVGAYGEYRDRGLQVVGIVHRDSAESAQRFATDQGATWQMLMDPDETAWKALIGVGVPQTYFVDGDGIVRWVNIGPFSADGLAYGISRILPPQPSSAAARPARTQLDSTS
ncbi:MAG: TlpA disulfide reductase family protein [Chloroflexota bacterium]